MTRGYVRGMSYNHDDLRSTIISDIERKRLRVAEVCAAADISESTFYRWMRSPLSNDRFVILNQAIAKAKTMIEM